MRLQIPLIAVTSVLGLLVAAGSGAAQQAVPHLERCTSWDYGTGHLGTSNSCDMDVSVRFMTMRDQHFVEVELGPGRRFDSGLSRDELGSDWWMFTTCPVGYVSDVPFQPENRETIIPSKYGCVRK